MSQSWSQGFVKNLLLGAGIEVNGKQPWDIQIHEDRFYRRILSNTSLNAGESYMEGWWDCERLDEFFKRVMVAQTQNNFMDFGIFFRNLKNYLFNLQTVRRSRQVAKVHYDLDNQLYAYMLGPTMAYTCAYWKDATTLDEAQEKKYDLICRKLSLEPKDNVLELGCGWGGFAKYAAMHYGCSITSVNISEQQIAFAKKICAALPINLHLADYRDTAIYNPNNVQFDKIVSIGMCEHIGNKNYGKFMQLVHEQLKDDGLFLLHTIGNNKTFSSLDPWTNKYIFPNGIVPSIQQLASAMEGLFIMEDWHNFGAYYDQTLMAWHSNFVKHWPQLSSHYDDRFYRMWVYYLLSCAGTFRARELQLWQIVLSKGRGRGIYERLA